MSGSWRVTATLSAVFPLAAAAAGPTSAPTTPPVGPVQSPRAVTAADLGPEIDPVKLARAPYNGASVFGTFDGFVSQCYAVANVWVYAPPNAPGLAAANVGYDYPPFYKPTWGEVFDHVARQMRCRWSFDAGNRQFKFEPADVPPPFGVAPDPGWRREDRGSYVWHAPADQPFGLDIYELGHYTADPGRPDLFRRVREYFAVRDVSGWPTPPTLGQMTVVKVAGADALYLRAPTPRPGGLWRQWSFVAPDGHAYLIVSAMPADREAVVGPAVDRMVASFTVGRQPTTVPAR